MTNATSLVDGLLFEQSRCEVPAEVTRIVERHRITLLGLAQALIAAGRREDEVITILQSAAESFSTRLKSEIEGMQS
ncbi:MAG: hypothetical protein ACK4IB_06915 [Erythrobacter sp.]